MMGTFLKRAWGRLTGAGLVLVLCLAVLPLSARAHTGTDEPWDSSMTQGPLGGAQVYYLTEDVVLEQTWVVPADCDVLCLNGHTLSLEAAEGSVISIPAGAELTIIDCQGDGKITGGKGTVDRVGDCCGGGIYNLGTLTLEAGTISGNSVSTKGYGGGVFNDGTFTMTGGNIADNSASIHGGGVFNMGTFHFQDGEIQNNQAAGYGGGISNSMYAPFSMTGGRVEGNSAKAGGGVNCAGENKSLSGGIITGNTATDEGGGASCSGTTISGTIQITGNTLTDNSTNNLFIGSSYDTITVGTLDSTASIGITLDSPTDESGLGFRDFTSGGAAYAANFTSDDSQYEIVASGDNLKLCQHDWSTDWTQGTDTHYHACKHCDTRKDEAAHDGTATCQAAAFCTVCGASHGTIDPGNHTGAMGSNVSNGDGTHTAVWSCCGATVTESCSGGEATCQAPAICTGCGSAYGTVDAGNHTQNLTYTQNADGLTHEKKYKCCGVVADAAESCSGGTATCTAQAVCQHCGKAYNGLDADNHTSAECTYSQNTDGLTHEKKYKCCGVVADANESCSGGTATCTDQAVCQHCGKAYNGLDADNHTSAEFTYSQNADGLTHEKKYKCCGVVADTAESCSGGTATCTEKALCQHCGKAYNGLDADNHTSTDLTYQAGENGSHDRLYACCGAVARTEGCTYDQKVSTDGYFAEKATCTETAKYFHSCLCGQKGTETFGAGKALGHDFPGGDWLYDDGEGHYRQCSRCDVADKGTLEDHVYTNSCDTTCNTCGYKRSITHSYAQKSDKDEHWEECKVCGKEKKNSREDHSGGEATCTEKAECEVCGKSYGKAKGHGKTVILNSRPATCSKEGYSGDTCCKICKEVLKEGKKSPTLDHDYKWVVDRYPTDSKYGLKHRECKVCGATDDEKTRFYATTDDSPNTADQMNLPLYFGLMALSAAALVTLGRKRNGI